MKCKDHKKPLTLFLRLLQKRCQYTDKEIMEKHMNLKDLNLNNITTDPMDTTFVDDLNEDIKVGFQHITMLFRSLSLFVPCCFFHGYSLMVFLTRKWPKKFKSKKHIWKKCNQGRQKLGKRLKE